MPNHAMKETGGELSISLKQSLFLILKLWIKLF